MPFIIASDVSIQFADGYQVFPSLSFSIDARYSGLVGRNGSGKSILGKLIAGTIKPTTGHVVRPKKVGYWGQFEVLDQTQTIAQYLGVDTKLDALRRVEQGSCDLVDFDIIADDWGIEETINELLVSLRLTSTSLKQTVTSLSGGQQTVLGLWRLFQSDHDLLILDEPSNHLDQQAKAWLLAQIARFDNKILLISHDRTLLNQCDTIYHLDNLGISQYRGNYAAYEENRRRETEALCRRREDAAKACRKAKKKIQENVEKAQRREKTGLKQRKNSSHGKSLLDTMKNSAQSSRGAQKERDLARLEDAKTAKQALDSRVASATPQQLVFDNTQARKGRILDVISVRLPFGTKQSVTMSLNVGEKVYISGENGSGKSTLLKTISGVIEELAGEINNKLDCIYLDQHFSLLDSDLDMADNLTRLCPHFTLADSRNLLASIGFRGDTVFKKVSYLSGGERMKLCILAVSHQQNSPLLLLDEPDNHLDLDSKIMLAEAISSYSGSVLLVSHDQHFVEQSGIWRKYKMV
ncbi:elongation factor 3 [Veronia nyctiphanis]|uniref:Elongation factor 3 n=1 Tax=Veronia nyctiphanis TaxID=1278244 RepID=A0A4Q0YZF3_9GAMM|nr:ABC-F family ATP-binding cassette domain-containing protein [Veronia nyctiphanis]RXJ74521.1 elongation factor 3 [Veronia nyctiphanis]